MSEDRYFADDEEASAIDLTQEPLKPIPFSSSAREPDLDDIFEGEPDSDLFTTFDFDNAGPAIAQPSYEEPGAATGRDHADLDETSMQRTKPLVAASGGLDQEDTPHDGSLGAWRGWQVTSEIGVLDWKNDSPDNGALQLPIDTQDQTDPDEQGVPGPWLSHVRALDFLRQKEEHLKELNGEPIRKRHHGNYAYSSSVGSDLDSEDGNWIQPRRQENNRINTTETAPFLHHNVPVEPPKTAKVIQEDKKQSESQYNDQDRPTVTNSSSGSSHPSLLHSWPHLSEVTPAGVEGHHPSIIPRSPRKGTSRASSLASETGLDTEEQSQPLTDKVLCERDMLSTTEASKLFQSLLSPVKTESHLTVVGNDSTSTLFRRPDIKRSTSSSRSSPLRRLADAADVVSTLAVTVFPTPILSAVPSRPDTPRPSTELEESGGFERSHVPPIFPLVHIPGLEIKQAQYGPLTDLDTPTQIAGQILHVKTPSSVLPSGIQTMGSGLSTRDVPWQEPRVSPEMLERCPPQAQGIGPSKELLSPEISTLPGALVSESTIVDRSMHDPSAKGGDLINSVVPPARDQPLSSPPTGLQDAIQIKRGLRKTTTPRHDSRKDLTGTRGRAVSVTAKKAKLAISNNNSLTTGVQGEGIKVTKTKSKRPAGNARQKSIKSVDEHKSVTDDIPEVPKLPENLILDDAKVYPRTIKLKFPAFSYNEAARSPPKGASSSQDMGKTNTGTEEGSCEQQDSPEIAISDLSTPPSTHKQQLKIPKTRKPITFAKTFPKQVKTDSTTGTVVTPEHNRMDVDTTSPAYPLDQLQPQDQNHDQQNEPAIRITKKRPVTRKQTPGRVQKLTIRESKTSARAPTYNSNQIADVLEAATQVEQSEKSNQTPPTKTKPRATPRRATPAPRKRKQDKKALDEEIPPMPPMPAMSTTPKRAFNNDAGDGRLTPQSAERGQPKTPLRRSPRLSGVEPGQGL